MCTTGMAGAFEGQEKVLDPLELEVWVSCKMPCGWGAGNGTQTLLGMHQVVLTTVIFPARVCRYLHMIAGAHRDLWHQIPLKLGMQAVLSQPMWCWEPNSSPPLQEWCALLTVVLSLPTFSCSTFMVVSDIMP